MGNSHFQEETNAYVQKLYLAYKTVTQELVKEDMHDYFSQLTMEERKKVFASVRSCFVKKFKYMPADATRFPMILDDRNITQLGFVGISRTLKNVLEEKRNLFSKISIAHLMICDPVYLELRSLVAFSNIVILEISQVAFGTTQLYKLVNDISKHPTIECLMLKNVTSNGNKLCKMISNCAYANQLIWSYDISMNNITDEGARYIYEMIKDMTHVKSIVLENNDVNSKLLMKINSVITRNIEGGGLTYLTWEENDQVKEGRTSPSLYRESMRFKSGYYEVCGRREAMEDAVGVYGSLNNTTKEDLFSIFDGHGGDSVSEYCIATLEPTFKQKLRDCGSVETALSETFVSLDEGVRGNAETVGATALVVYISDNLIYSANAGDTRCVLCKKGKPVRLSTDHKPKLEKKRIIEEGGFVEDNRVNGILAISRAIGDHGLGVCVTPNPTITVTEITDDARFLILGCDGVWDVLTDLEAVEYINRKIKQGYDAFACARKLCKKAYDYGSFDNISVVIVFL